MVDCCCGPEVKNNLSIRLTDLDLKAEIDATLADVQKLPAMPSLVLRIQGMLQDPDVDIRALSAEISNDIALTAGIVRLSNSAYYSPRNRIHSVQEAIMTLGLQTVLSIVMVTITRGILSVPMDAYRLSEKDLWQSSLVTAELCREIASAKKICVPDTAFTAGLLHDIGRVVLVPFFRQVYQQIQIDMQKNPTLRFSDLERKYMGYSHFEISGKILRSWNFPEAMAESIECILKPALAKQEAGLAATLHIAHFLTNAAGVGADPYGLSEALDPIALKSTRLTDAELEDLYRTVPETMEKLKDLLSL
ncbi:MAG: HDOD domain-containing protein [Spirochaetales bacterium]|nr:HDOD domain-containing protein [Spirochaetales bacterium]